MALNYDLTKIADQDALWIGDDDDAPMNPVTNALIHATMAIGMPTITAENVTEVWARISVWQDILGAMLVGPGGIDQFVTPDDVRAHIGLKTNASALTNAKFDNNAIKELRAQAKRRFEK